MSFSRRRRFGRGNFRQMVQRSPAQKNIVQTFGSARVAGTPFVQSFVDANNAPDGISAVSWPCTIKMFYIDLAIHTDAAPATPSEAVFVVYKNSGGALANPTAANLTALGNWAGKVYTFLSLQDSLTSSAARLRYVGWVRIPKRYQVFNESDTMNLAMVNLVGAWTGSHMIIYKWRQ